MRIELYYSLLFFLRKILYQFLMIIHYVKKEKKIEFKKNQLWE